MLRFSDLSPEEAEDYRQVYVASLPALVARLRQRLTRTGGPAVDGTVHSLPALGAWLTTQLVDDAEPDGLSGTPRWWGDAESASIPEGVPGRLLTAQELRLVDEVGAYLATVLAEAVPGAEWIVLHDKRHKNNVAENETMLKMPNRDVISPVDFVYGVAVRRLLYQRSPEPGVMDALARKYVPGC